MSLVPSLRRRARRSRGFTLIELMMALTAGLLVSAAAFLLAKNASAVFQEETRITGAQLSASLGLKRLASDIGRAGFLSTPNIAADPYVCDESGTWPPLLTNLRAVTITEAGSVAADSAALADSTANGFSPDTITLSGSFDSSEEFPVRTVQPGGGGKVVYLQTKTLPMERTCKGATLADCFPRLQAIFKSGRILRLVTGEGHEIFGLIDAASLNGDELAVKLQAVPTFPEISTNPRGYPANCTGCRVSAIAVVRYQLQTLKSHPQYGALVAPVSTGATGDALRTELTRVELGADMLPLAPTLELVAEYAVDLKFGISFIDQATTAITDLPVPLPANPAIYMTPAERIRTVHVRFSTRSRAPDREVDIGVGPDGRRHRFLLPVAGSTKYARMRTLYTQVALQNLVKYW
ncbi:MAG: prepilin-type N-terminal cleavage/methylation domain-containing protein [Polyangiaceae bacterium]